MTTLLTLQPFNLLPFSLLNFASNNIPVMGGHPLFYKHYAPPELASPPGLDTLSFLL
jgi:hypothetical protein